LVSFTATEMPYSSPQAVSLAIISLISVHVPDTFWNMYTEPESESPP
jgi:hypothetical protein